MWRWIKKGGPCRLQQSSSIDILGNNGLYVAVRRILAFFLWIPWLALASQMRLLLFLFFAYLR